MQVTCRGEKIFDPIVTHRWPFLIPYKFTIPYQIIFHCRGLELHTYIYELELHILCGTALSVKLHNFVIYTSVVATKFAILF